MTGATGFVGRHLVRHLQIQGRSFRILARRDVPGVDTVLGDLTHPASLVAATAGMDTVVHCAGFAHAHSGVQGELDIRHRDVNLQGTLALARAAAEAGVRRFVFCSSVKAVADPGERCVDESFADRPLTAYGRAKREAEEGLAAISLECGLEVVNLRLAVVFGPGSRGNVERMCALVRCGLFPPLPETGNHRSMVHVDDVVAALMLATDTARAAGQTYFVAHPEALSGRGLYVAMCEAIGRRAAAWSIPEGMLRLSASAADQLQAALGRRLPFGSQVVSSLLDSAWFDATRIQQELGWQPRLGMVQGLRTLLQDERRN
ncbi:NAD-dependent epimerase/dehydratase family protein [Uliginosibacterium sp. H1]|nr:NAD-dependent epimerase/dehydratase family protein [Uliginosibacterium sp. H1]